MSLSDEDRLTIQGAVQMWTGHQAARGVDDLSSVRNPVERAVEAIVQRAINEALTEAANAIDLRSDLFAESTNDLPTEMRDERVRHNAMASGLNNAARIVRART